MEKLQTGEKSQDSSNIFNITITGFEQVLREGLSLDQIFYLDCINKNIDLSSFSSPKISAIRQSVIRKGLITSELTITESGRIFLISLQQGESFTSLKVGRINMLKTDFDKWWETYPTTDVFTHKGKSFPGSRGLRVKKDECRQKFYKIIQEGELKAEDLIRALQYEVTLKKEASIREGVNKMSYMQNSLTYLNQRTFDNFLEISKTEAKSTSSSHITDI